MTDDRSDLILTWIGENGPEVASSVADVPEESRKEVRVQDPNVPPEERDPRFLFFADLTKKDANGQYKVKVVTRSEYETKRQKAAQANLPKPQQSPDGIQALPQANTPKGTAPVTMYATRHCPVCIKARRWLLENKIPYVEKDIERDAQAAHELRAKGQAQGVPTNGVPVFDIRGKLLPGFDPSTILALLGGGQGTQTSI